MAHDVPPTDVELGLALAVIDRVAPEELLLVEVLAHTQRQSQRGGHRSLERMLGFGVEAASALLTPVALVAATEVVRYLAAEVIGAADIGARLRRLTHRIDRNRTDQQLTGGATAESGQISSDPAAAGQDPGGLTLEQTKRVRAVVLDACSRGGIPEQRASLVADAVLGVLLGEA